MEWKLFFVKYFQKKKEKLIIFFFYDIITFDGFIILFLSGLELLQLNHEGWGILFQKNDEFSKRV